MRFTSLLWTVAEACQIIPECSLEQWPTLSEPTGFRLRSRHNPLKDPGSQASIRVISTSTSNNTSLPTTSSSVIPSILLKTFHVQKHFREESEILGCLLGVRGVIQAYCQLPSDNALVLEYLPGGDLVSFSNYPVTDVRMLSLQLITTVHQLHALGWIHHDIKPANVVLDTSGSMTKLIDFGLAKRMEDGGSVGRGTAITMAPEQQRRSRNGKQLRPLVVPGTPLSSALDWWSLGVTLFYLHCRNSMGRLSPDQPLSTCYPYRITRNNRGEVREMRWQHQEIMETYFDDDTRELMELLMQEDPKKREFDGDHLDLLLSLPYFSTTRNAIKELGK